MGKRFGTIALVTVLMLLFAVTACKKKESSPLMQPDPNLPPEGELKVTFVSPSGKTAAPHETEQLVVMFDHPMVPLEQLPEGDGPAMLELSPSVPGKYRWLGSKTMSFTPAKRFPYSREITISIRGDQNAGDRVVAAFAVGVDVPQSRIERFCPQKHVVPIVFMVHVWHQQYHADRNSHSGQ